MKNDPKKTPPRQGLRLLVGILVVACDRECMVKQPSSWVSRIVVGATALLMFGAAAGMFFF